MENHNSESDMSIFLVYFIINTKIVFGNHKLKISFWNLKS